MHARSRPQLWVASLGCQGRAARVSVRHLASRPLQSQCPSSFVPSSQQAPLYGLQFAGSVQSVGECMLRAGLFVRSQQSAPRVEWLPQEGSCQHQHLPGSKSHYRHGRLLAECGCSRSAKSGRQLEEWVCSRSAKSGRLVAEWGSSRSGSGRGAGFLSPVRQVTQAKMRS